MIIIKTYSPASHAKNCGRYSVNKNKQTNDIIILAIKLLKHIFYRIPTLVAVGGCFVVMDLLLWETFRLFFGAST